MKTMKRLSALALILLLLFALSATALAAEEFNTRYYRLNDMPDVLDPDIVDIIDDMIFVAIYNYRMDFPIFLLDDLEPGEDLVVCTRSLYEDNDFGYGEEKDGIALLIDLGNHQIIAERFGRAVSLFSDSIDAIENNTAEDFEKYSDYTDAIRAYLSRVWGLLDEAGEYVDRPMSGEIAPGASATEEAATVSAAPVPAPEVPAPARPDWYPADVSAWEPFHADNAPRVVDDADLFSPEQEAQLSRRIAEIIRKHGHDLVIYTTYDSYGFSHDILSADFYDFCGYGLGDDYSGTVLLLCMDPGNRGWYTSAAGSARKFFTYENINRIDDAMAPYLARGDMFNGMMNYLGSIDTLYTKGRVPAALNYTGPFFFALAVGALAGAFSLLSKTKKMKSVGTATRASSALVPGSFRLSHSRDVYLYSNITRTKRAPAPSRSSGGGGGSSFSHSYSGSSGRTHTGGGRRF